MSQTVQYSRHVPQLNRQGGSLHSDLICTQARIESAFESACLRLNDVDHVHRFFDSMNVRMLEIGKRSRQIEAILSSVET